MFLIRSFSLLSHFVVVEHHELSKSTIHLLSVPLIQNQLKNKQAKNIFYQKSKLNQVSVLVLLDRQLLCQVQQNAILHPIIY